MTGLFTPSTLHSEGDTWWFHLTLDPRQPFLADHRPGGFPLFGTVMQMEALAAAASRLTAAAIRGIHDVHVAKACILHHPSATHNVMIEVRRSTAAPEREFHCTLFTRGAATDEIHMQATLRTGVTDAGRGQPSRPTGERRQQRIVAGATIYELFFHGRSFQVIGSAQSQDGAMICRLAQNLPPSHTAGDVSLLSPRLIELGLQTAGLLELANSGRMMIPDYLSAVQRVRALDVGSDEPLFAVAKRAANAASINIRIVDAGGATVMLIDDYRTVALPFPADVDKCASLAAALRNTTV